MRVLTKLAAVVALVVTTAVQLSCSKQLIPLGGSSTAPVSPAVNVRGLVYVSTTLATDATGAMIKGDIKAQTSQALENIGAALKAAGSSLSNAASVMVCLKSAWDFPAMNEAYAAFWPTDPPARTTLVMSQLSNPASLIEISAVAITNGGERVVIQPQGWMKPPSPYSYGIKSGDTLYLAGVVSRNGKDNSTVTGDITTQTKTAMDNGAAILREAGMSMADVVSSRVYLADATTFQAMNATYRTYFPTAPPARATVKAAPTSAAQIIEVTMVAVKDPARKAILPANPDGSAPTPNANLSPAIQVGNRLYVAGMTGATAANKGDLKAQTAESFARLGQALKAAGFEWSDVVDGIAFLPDLTHVDDLNAAYRERFAKGFPARVTVGTPLMGGDAMVEIMLTAVK